MSVFIDCDRIVSGGGRSVERCNCECVLVISGLLPLDGEREGEDEDDDGDNWKGDDEEPSFSLFFSFCCDENEENSEKLSDPCFEGERTTCPFSVRI